MASSRAVSASRSASASRSRVRYFAASRPALPPPSVCSCCWSLASFSGGVVSSWLLSLTVASCSSLVLIRCSPSSQVLSLLGRGGPRWSGAVSGTRRATNAPSPAPRQSAPQAARWSRRRSSVIPSNGGDNRCVREVGRVDPEPLNVGGGDDGPGHVGRDVLAGFDTDGCTIEIEEYLPGHVHHAPCVG